jgi:hypothetical protein
MAGGNSYLELLNFTLTPDHLLTLGYDFQNDKVISDAVIWRLNF